MAAVRPASGSTGYRAISTAQAAPKPRIVRVMAAMSPKDYGRTVLPGMAFEWLAPQEISMDATCPLVAKSVV